MGDALVFLRIAFGAKALEVLFKQTNRDFVGSKIKKLNLGNTNFHMNLCYSYHRLESSHFLQLCTKEIHQEGHPWCRNGAQYLENSLKN